MAADAVEEAPVIKAQSRKELLTLLAPALGKAGFHSEKTGDWDGAFAKAFEGGRQTVHINLSGSGDELRCVIQFATTHDLVEEIYEGICGRRSSVGGAKWSLFFALSDMLGEGINWKYPLPTNADIRSLVSLLEAKAMPILERCLALEDLDALIQVDGVFPTRTERRFATLIVARLAGNPHFEDLAEAFRLRFEKYKYSQEVTDKLRQLVTYLRESVGPVAE